jgi:hypothetical protein
MPSELGRGRRPPATAETPKLAGCSGRRVLQVELQVLDVRRDLLQLPVAGACLLGGEEVGGVLRGQGDGQVTDTVLVRRPDRCGVAEAGAGVDDDAVGRGRLLPGPWLRGPNKGVGRGGG